MGYVVSVVEDFVFVVVDGVDVGFDVELVEVVFEGVGDVGFVVGWG